MKSLSEWNDRLDASDTAIGEILDWLGQQLAPLEQKRSTETVDEYLADRRPSGPS